MCKNRGGSDVDLVASVKRGTASGLRILWELAKVIIPAVTAVHVLEQTGYLHRLSEWLGPVMAVFGLPGEAALVLVMANFVSIYAALATILALAMPIKQTTIVAAMVLVNHAAITETALVARAGARASWVLAARTAAMLLVGLVLHWTLP